ncbi:unnamed protein product [Lactuca saligna]|uniref:Uncharacterized protein n=1 Tax=Lactuca saligna TaxID=75948 RepID=A0AA35YGU8_LACSI|nr:unnamed protein product [Lactuca saligna]
MWFPVTTLVSGKLVAIDSGCCLRRSFNDIRASLGVGGGPDFLIEERNRVTDDLGWSSEAGVVVILVNHQRLVVVDTSGKKRTNIPETKIHALLLTNGRRIIFLLSTRPPKFLSSINAPFSIPGVVSGSRVVSAKPSAIAPFLHPYLLRFACEAASILRYIFILILNNNLCV